MAGLLWGAAAAAPLVWGHYKSWLDKLPESSFGPPGTTISLRDAGKIVGDVVKSGYKSPAFWNWFSTRGDSGNRAWYHYHRDKDDGGRRYTDARPPYNDISNPEGWNIGASRQYYLDKFNDYKPSNPYYEPWSRERGYQAEKLPPSFHSSYNSGDRLRKSTPRRRSYSFRRRSFRKKRRYYNPSSKQRFYRTSRNYYAKQIYRH